MFYNAKADAIAIWIGIGIILFSSVTRILQSLISETTNAANLYQDYVKLNKIKKPSLLVTACL
jgi:hypothetical protein